MQVHLQGNQMQMQMQMLCLVASESAEFCLIIFSQIVAQQHNWFDNGCRCGDKKNYTTKLFHNFVFERNQQSMSHLISSELQISYHVNGCHQHYAMRFSLYFFCQYVLQNDPLIHCCSHAKISNSLYVMKSLCFRSRKFSATVNNIINKRYLKAC